ncbi:MAG: DMT family transporter [Alphaproteobacteria bacterium]|nr:DMT family transporter [Alphaproteobacteria bacterium]
MIGAVSVFAVLNAAIKWQVARYPVSEVVFIRCLFALIPCLVVVGLSGGLKLVRTRRLGWHVSRSTLQFISMNCAFLAYGMMPLADAVAIGFASPIILTALSVPLLGEKVGVYRWSAVVLGFVGVLIMVKPSGDMLQSGAVFALANALFGAMLSIGIRRLSATEASATLVFYNATTTFAISAMTLPFFTWVPPAWEDVAMIGGIGVSSGIAQFWWTQAFRFCPAAILAPFSYMSMIWAVLLGFVVWGDVPTPSLIVGAVIVAACGLFIAYRETRRRGAARQPPKPAS